MHERGERTTDTSEHRARDGRADSATDVFVAHRNLLFTVAYEMLGSAADAEDVLQETWLRWADVDLDTVREQRAYLVRITTRQALTRLRTLRRRKESYVGPWLPEPLLTAPDVAEDIELADSVSMAMLLVLETLAPTERAVFVLREVFDLSYDEIAEAVDKTPAAVRQIAHRARAHVAARRPRAVVSPAERPRDRGEPLSPKRKLRRPLCRAEPSRNSRRAPANDIKATGVGIEAVGGGPARADRAVLVQHNPYGTFRLDMDKRLDLLPAHVPHPRTPTRPGAQPVTEHRHGR
ncbi:sigma-70 family RNA polymerase sigma factor [Streptomyces scopuliridis]|uniref:Sigma-70 family RNA polymerase sigma factor n=1 Tax=Streptomyces scopuliridis TaxID=452529 RepID=A0ACD4ZWP1_9ACTN|nr:sigma-70 family RNA polymerase sigma factor [Streptomyces scopuliridis]WSC02731.1 sigma-70 family RNA polymerase sigma factor [Streptomyces scopuliridis]WSC03736.1 sigma-70 family RNA polymerase sigma factor [Streptomyces scopuliridis]